MKKLIAKELKLNVKWPVYLFCLLGTMVLIPNYVIIVGMGYTIMQIFTYLQIARENLSQEFNSTLPVKRSHIVASVVFVVTLFQMMTFAVAAICVPFAKLISPNGNVAGMDANIAFLGISLLCFAVFNAIFVPSYFKTGYKFGIPLLLGLAGFVVTYGICETLVQAVPALTPIFDSYSTDGIWYRVGLLLVGIATYITCTVFATKSAVKKFEKVSL